MEEEIENKLLFEINKLKVPEGYLRAGYPNYFTLFGRDSLISAWQMIEIDPTIAKDTLIILAKYQGKITNNKSEEEPGKILHEHRFKPEDQSALLQWQFPYFGGVDSTPLFVIVAEKYFEKTNDRNFLSQIWVNITMALNWISVYGDSDQDHFIEYKRKNPRGLFHQGWRDNSEDHLKIIPPVAIVEVQGYAYAAYTAGIKLAEYFTNNNTLKDLWIKKANALKEQFQKTFWWEEESCYYLALDKNKSAKKSVSSNQGHLLFTGIISQENQQKIVKRLFKSDIFTPYGIRTVSENDLGFDYSSYHLGSIWPHDNWVIYYGLKQSGFSDEAEQIKQGLLLAYKKLGHIPELYAVKNNKIISLSKSTRQHERKIKNVTRANTLQTWAVCGLLNMLWEDK